MKSLLSLTRYKLSLSVAFSGVVGYTCVSHVVNSLSLSIFFGIFLLSCGASALNQVQEKNHDEKMPRTWKRPLPLGILTTKAAFIIAFLFICTGLVILFFAGEFIVLGVGILSIIWYNGLYTRLKRLTAYAVFPGSLTGVFPILIGWFAAGGSYTDWSLYCISFFMAMWQIPHFLLLMQHYNDEYKMAGFPTFSDFFNHNQLNRQIFVWTVSTVIVSMLMSFFPIIVSLALKLILLFSGILLIGVFTKELFSKSAARFKFVFIAINSYMLIVMILLFLSALL